MTENKNYNQTYPFIAIHQKKAWGLTKDVTNKFIFRLISDEQWGHSGTHFTQEEAICCVIDMGAVVINTETQKQVKVVVKKVVEEIVIEYF